MDASPIIIIGMGSSGTRMLVEILEHCGVFMGGPLAANEFKEPQIFYAGVNAFVDEFRYVDPLRPDWEDIVNARALDVDQFVQTVLPQAYKASGYCEGKWGFKDPRNSFVLPLYIRAFPACRVLHVIRDGRDVALTKITEQWPKLKNTKRIDRWFRVWENNVGVCASYRSRLPPNQFFEVRYEDVCVGAETAIDTLSKLMDCATTDVETAVRRTAHQKRMGKWLTRDMAFGFATNSDVLRMYGYI